MVAVYVPISLAKGISLFLHLIMKLIMGCPMQQFSTNVLSFLLSHFSKWFYKKQGGFFMLNFTVKPGEYFTIGDNIQVVYLGGSKTHCKLMVDAPKSLSIIRGSVIEKNALDEDDKIKLKKYYPEPDISPELKEKYKNARRKKENEK